MKLRYLFLSGLMLGSMCIKVQATQADSSKPIPINLGFNAGTTISWAQSDEVIEQIWLDNPSFATIDLHGCVAGWKGCSESNAQIMHLKRNKDLKLKHIPYADSTLLTVITRDVQTNRTRIHFYTIKKYDRTTSTLVVAAKAPAPIVERRATAPVNQFGLSPLRLAEEVDNALDIARQQEKKDYKLMNKLNKFANLLKMGTKEPHALALSGVSPELIQQILQAGK